MRRAAFLLSMLVSTSAFSAHGGDAKPIAAPVATAATASADPKADTFSVADLDKLLAPLVGEGDANARKNAIKSVQDLGPDATAAIAKELAEFRKSPSQSAATNQNAAMFAAVKAAKDSKKGQGDYDLLDALVDLGTSGPGAKTAITTITLARALARIGTTASIRALVPVAEDHGGTLRAEITRLVHDLGDRALPALLEARKDQSPEVRRFSHQQIEALGKKTPGDAVQMKSNQVLADVLRAYADVHENDAIPVILSFVNSDRAEVQAAARDAILRFGPDAVWKVREAYTNLTGKNPPDGARPEDVAKELFAAYDRVRLQEVYELLDAGKKAQSDGKLDDAIADFDKVLARQPMLDRRAETVPGYVAYAESLEEKDPPAARAAFKKALRIDPDGSRAPHVRAEILYLEGKELEARGVADPELFRRALAADPAHDKSRQELDRLQDTDEDQRARMQKWAIAGGLGALALALLVLFGGKKRGKKNSPEPAHASH